jgi:hypothetical protein
MPGRSVAAFVCMALLFAACGDESDAPESCPGLGDPAVRCRFVGQLSDGDSSSPLAVNVLALNGPGSLTLRIGPPGEKAQFTVWTDDEVSGDAYVGDVQVVFTDLFEYGTLQMQILEGGRRLHMEIEAGSFFSPSTFDGRYVGR